MLFGNINILLLKCIKQNNLEKKININIDCRVNKIDNRVDDTKFSNLTDTTLDFFFLKNNLVSSCCVNVNYFFRSGFKCKLSNLFNYNIGWFLFNYNNSFNFKLAQINELVNLNNITKTTNEDLFSFNNLNILVKHVRLSRKIRKYTKNKIRYRSFLVTLRSRQIFGTTLRMWNLIYLNSNNSYRLKSFIINNLIWNNLLILEENLIEEGLSQTENKSISGDILYENTPQKIQFQMFDDMVHRK